MSLLPSWGTSHWQYHFRSRLERGTKTFPAFPSSLRRPLACGLCAVGGGCHQPWDEVGCVAIGFVLAGKQAGNRARKCVPAWGSWLAAGSEQHWDPGTGGARESRERRPGLQKGGWVLHWKVSPPTRVRGSGLRSPPSAPLAPQTVGQCCVGLSPRVCFSEERNLSDFFFHSLNVKGLI